MMKSEKILQILVEFKNMDGVELIIKRFKEEFKQ